MFKISSFNVNSINVRLEIVTHYILENKIDVLFLQEIKCTNENFPYKPSSPYSATKAAADMLIQSWARTHGLDYIITRPSNNYGKFQRFH